MKNNSIRSARSHPSSSKKAGNSDSILGTAATAGFAAAAAIGFGVLFMLVAAAIAASLPDPDAVTSPAALTASALGGIAGGILASKRERRRAFAEALLAAAIQNLLMLSAAAVISQHDRYSIWVKFGLHGALFAFYAIGAAIGGPRSASYKKRAQKRRRA